MYRLNQASDVESDGITGSHSVSDFWNSFILSVFRIRVVVILVGFHTVCIRAQCCVVEPGSYSPPPSACICSKFN
jgi:hypothetical protein